MVTKVLRVLSVLVKWGPSVLHDERSYFSRHRHQNVFPRWLSCATFTRRDAGMMIDEKPQQQQQQVSVVFTDLHHSPNVNDQSLHKALRFCVQWLKWGGSWGLTPCFDFGPWLKLLSQCCCNNNMIIYFCYREFISIMIDSIKISLLWNLIFGFQLILMIVGLFASD